MGPHTKDDPSKGIKKGDPVNTALHKFVARQTQYNLTDKGVRRSANLYRVRMDDPIHEADQAHYEMLCRQYIARRNQPEQPLKPIYKDSRSGLSASKGSQEDASNSGTRSEKKPEDQNDSLGFFDPPEDQNDSLGSERNRGPEDQNEPTNTLNVLFTNVETFNVTQKNINTKKKQSEPIRDAIGEIIEAKVSLLVSTLEDEKSIRRYRQLVGICIQNNVLSLIDASLQATAAKKKTGTLGKPGGYFQTILLKNLENCGIHVPSVSEVSANGVSVASAIRSSLGEIPGPSGAGEEDGKSETTSRKRTDSGTASSMENEFAEITELKHKGGGEWESWIAFVAAKRKQYEDATSGMTPGLRERSLASFSSPERQRSLWRQWQRERL